MTEMHEIPRELAGLMRDVVVAADHMFDNRVGDGEFLSIVVPTDEQWDNLGKAMIAYKEYRKREELGLV